MTPLGLVATVAYALFTLGLAVIVHHGGYRTYRHEWLARSEAVMVLTGATLVYCFFYWLVTLRGLQS